MFKDWKDLNQAVLDCEACPRLRRHCLKIAEEKKRAYKNQEYWGRPVPAFGDPKARLVLIGLAPAAHGANRTGRMFTGDRSGEWLYRALHKAGFANQPESTSIDDGLKLTDAYITATARCAPPDNKPTPEEIQRCAPFLRWELEHLTNAKVYLGLGKIGFDAAWNALLELNLAKGCKPEFGHAKTYEISRDKWIIGSYHPSQQNTFTKRLTEPMFDEVFTKAKKLFPLKSKT